MAKNNFFIRPDYVVNPAATFDTSEKLYWDEHRAATAASYQQAVYDWAEDIVRECGLRSIADLGCGTAVKLARLHSHIPSLKVVGYDQPNAIRLCISQHEFGAWVPVNFDNSGELEKDEYDLIISSDVIEHLENPDRLFECIERLSNDNTYVLISTPERILLRGENCTSSPIRHHVREWSQHEFSCYVRSRGWQIVETRLLPAFNCFSSTAFFKRALRRWLRMKTIRYTQALLIKRTTGS